LIAGNGGAGGQAGNPDSNHGYEDGSPGGAGETGIIIIEWD
jgi:hypothetical protein